VTSGFDYDLVVIGAGSGGVRAARIAAGTGARVLIAEEYRIGGTCVIRGCVPKKLLVYASRFADAFEDAAGYGWTLEAPRFDWASLIAAKDREIDRLSVIYRRNLDTAGVEIVEERAVVTGANGVRLVKSGRTLSTRFILVATGGHPDQPDDIPGIEHAITSNEAFHLGELPKRVLVVGGGYIALEFAGVFNGLGAETTVLYRGAKVLRGFDEDVRDVVSEEMRHRGVDIVCGDTLATIEKTPAGLVVTTHAGRTLTVDQVMLATGRRPNTAGLGLEDAGVVLGPRGEVRVDQFSRSDVPSIYAVGDVTDRANLTPVAIREGHAFADTVFGNRPSAVDHALIPTAVFSTPEVGVVGLSEADALVHCPSVDVYKARFRPMLNTLSGRQERMLMKLVVDADSDRVLGVHIVGDHAGEMIQLAGIAVQMGATKADFDATVAVHPTAAEELVTMRTPTERHRRAAAE
jgi:glutathione reductase (NADPH)